MTRRLLALLLAVGVVTVLAAMSVHPGRYAGEVIHLRLTTVGLPAAGVTDIWYAPGDRLLYSLNSASGMTLYIRCPTRQPCRSNQGPDFNATTLDATATWGQILAAYVPQLPGRHGRPRQVLLHGRTASFYEVPIPQIPSLHRQYWVDPRSGRVVLYREISGSYAVLTLRVERTILPSGSLDAHFFQPPRRSESWLQPLQRWVVSRLPAHP